MNFIHERTARTNNISYQPIPEGEVKIIAMEGEILARSGFRKCKFPYIAELYKMIRRERNSAIVFKQTHESYPNYEYDGEITFKMGEKTRKLEIAGDNFPVIR